MHEKMIVIHDTDNDGFGGAFAVWSLVRNDAHYIPCPHGSAWPNVQGSRHVCFVDLCPPADVLEAFLRKNTAVTVIDHHATAIKAIEKMKGVFGFHAVHDVKKSAAVLTWEHFVPTEVPHLLLYIQDRDLWAHELPFTREINCWLSMQPMGFATWDYIAANLKIPRTDIPSSLLTQTACREGAVVLTFQEGMVDRIAANATEREVAGHLVPTVNTPILQSEIGELLARGKPFAACWHRVGNTIRYSLRSDKDGLDVSVIAKEYGGGGHPRAAGYTVKL